MTLQYGVVKISNLLIMLYICSLEQTWPLPEFVGGRDAGLHPVQRAGT